MKAERRHALQQNDLAAKIIQLPDYGKIWVRRGIVALVVIVVLATIILLRFNDSGTKRAESEDALAQAMATSQNLHMQMPGQASPTLDPQFYHSVEALFLQAQDALGVVEQKSKDPAMLSQAAVVRGDINLYMVTLPRAAATTQPSVEVRPTTQEALTDANTAYNKVIDQYSDQRSSVLAARFGLATLAEDQGNWQAARQQYQAIADDSNAPEVYHLQAKARIAAMSKLETKPMITERAIAPLIDPTKLPEPISLEGSTPALPPTVAPAAPSLPAAKSATTHPK
jgi:hypothetical protein